MTPCGGCVPGELPTILVIDDEEVVRLLFDSLLTDEGFPVLLADTGRQGVELLDKHQPPLVLVDKNLPDLSGLDLIATQKQRHPNTEFIMITGYASLDSAVRAMEMGAFSYLTKPFSDMEVVLDRIKSALEVNHLRQETILLKERLSRLPKGLPATPSQHESSQDKAATEVVLGTISLLESFLDKRETIPSAPAWSRLVDMFEQQANKLKTFLKTLEP